MNGLTLCAFAVACSVQFRDHFVRSDKFIPMNIQDFQQWCSFSVTNDVNPFTWRPFYVLYSLRLRLEKFHFQHMACDPFTLFDCWKFFSQIKQFNGSFNHLNFILFFLISFLMISWVFFSISHFFVDVALNSTRHICVCIVWGWEGLEKMWISSAALIFQIIIC